MDFFEELVAAIYGLLLEVNFVCDADARNMGALVAHLRIPVPQVGVGYLARHVKYHNADMCSEVVSRVQLIERLLSRRVPNVFSRNRNRS